MELQGRVDRIRASGLGLAAISDDPVPVLADFARRRGIAYPLLSDAGSKTIRAYGLLNTSIPETNPVFGIPYPGTFVLDRAGVVTARFFEDAYQDRDSGGTMLVRQGFAAAGPTVAVETPHMDIVASLTDAVVAPGTVFSIVLDLTPKAGVHVYAPGVTGYRPVAVSVEPAPALTIRDLTVPQAEDYYFAPLDEHVKVFQRPFRLVLALALDASREGQETLKDTTAMTLRARLEFQACNDKVCFAPESVPLSWSVAVRQLDRERVKR